MKYNDIHAATTIKFRCLLFLLGIGALTSQGQVTKTETGKTFKIGTVKSVGLFVAELTYTIKHSDTLYTLVYNNFDYSSVTDLQKFSFNNSNSAVDSLYSYFIEAYDKEKGNKTSLNVGTSVVTILTIRDGGVKVIKVYVLPSGGHFRLESKKQIKKLFGKE